MGIQIYPLYFLATTNGSVPQPTDPLLYEAVQKYCEREFGERKRFDLDLKTWVMAEHGEEGWTIHSVVSLRNELACYTFHVTPPVSGDTPSEIKDAWRKAEQMRDALIYRATSFLHDRFGLGVKIQIFVEPKAERFWSKFLRRIGAKPSNRWELTV